MPSNSSNNSRIAKNTLFLYFRLLFTLAVSLFTSRIVLSALGISDYGVYNVVAGVVGMFSLLTTSLSAAISRFLTFALGKDDQENLRKVFSTSVTILIGLGIIILILAEILGVWFLNNKLNIPEDRLYAANWIIHFSIITFIVNLISVPYNAAIIAHEKMSIYAYISILEVVLKLIIVYLLYISPYDKLITYAVLLTSVAIIVRIVYGIYCGRQFAECKYKFVWDKPLVREMTSFAWWNFFGSGAYLFNTQGVNIVTNIYFNVTANAARGVANQVEGIVKQFVFNFTTAINPQITKSYAQGNLNYTYSLVCYGSKFCYFLMLLFTVPFMFEAEIVMKLWLNEYPPEAPLFLRLSLIGTMVDLLGNSPAVAAWATGNIKKYYIYVSSVGCLVFPLSWVAFALGMPAFTSYIIFFVIYVFVLFVKLYVLKGLINFPVIKYFKEVLGSIGYTTIFSILLPAAAYFLLPRSLASSLVIILLSVISVAATVYFIGLNKAEREKVNTFVFGKIKTLFHVN